MTIQQYFVVEENVVTNSVIWDGNTQTWTPPADATMLISATTPAMIWEAVVVDNKVTDYILVKQIGAGNIGFTWDGFVLTTNQPKPAIPVQPVTTGTQSA
jgi:hypothetical protein